MTSFEPEPFLRVKVSLLTLFVTTEDGELTVYIAPVSTPDRHE